MRLLRQLWWWLDEVQAAVARVGHHRTARRWGWVLGVICVALLVGQARHAVFAQAPGPAGARSDVERAVVDFTPADIAGLTVIEATLATATLEATRDSFTASNRGGTNFGGDENLAVGYQTSDGDPGALRSFIQFDFPGALPSGATINSARVRLYQRSATGLEDMRIVIRQPGSSWDEFGITWDNQPGFVGDERASVFVDSSVGYKEWDITGLVREWQSGAAANHGIIVEGLEEPTENRRQFFARNTGDPNLRPVLIIDYTPTGTIPPPISSFVHPTNLYQATADFRVEWRADDPSGTGIAYYDVQVRQPGQAWQDWQTRTAATSATYVGEHGRTYEFRVRAVNQAGIAEPFPDAAQARTTLDLVVPTVTVNPVAPFSNQSSVLVTWSGQDDLSGIWNYDVQVRYGNGPWVDAAIGTLQTSFVLSGQAGVLAQVRVRAGDNARNLSRYDAPGASTAYTLDLTSPRACIQRFVPAVRADLSAFTVSWLGVDNPNGAGVAAFDVQYRFNGGVWTPFETGVAFTSAVFTPVQGTGLYEFRVRAIDGVGNASPFRVIGADGSVLVGAELPAPEYFAPTIHVAPVPDAFLAQCRRQ
ncbi:MAG: DNRLRE domain-containing protein [Litorilinea sp.]